MRSLHRGAGISIRCRPKIGLALPRVNKKPGSSHKLIRPDARYLAWRFSRMALRRPGDDPRPFNQAIKSLQAAALAKQLARAGAAHSRAAAAFAPPAQPLSGPRSCRCSRLAPVSRNRSSCRLRASVPASCLRTTVAGPNLARPIKLARGAISVALHTGCGKSMMGARANRH